MAERLREIYVVVDCPLEGELFPLEQCKLCEYFLGIDKATGKVICAFDENSAIIVDEDELEEVDSDDL